MDWIILVIVFIFGAISMFMMVCIGYTAKQEEPINRIHFYVARDKNGELNFYIGKPFRGDTEFGTNTRKNVMVLSRYSSDFLGLNENDYVNLKWEDEPLEVFVNMEYITLNLGKITNWCDTVADFLIQRWCYIDDLLPKEGGKQ